MFRLLIAMIVIACLTGCSSKLSKKDIAKIDAAIDEYTIRSEMVAQQYKKRQEEEQARREAEMRKHPIFGKTSEEKEQDKQAQNTPQQQPQDQEAPKKGKTVKEVFTKYQKAREVVVKRIQAAPAEHLSTMAEQVKKVALMNKDVDFYDPQNEESIDSTVRGIEDLSDALTQFKEHNGQSLFTFEQAKEMLDRAEMLAQKAKALFDASGSCMLSNALKAHLKLYFYTFSNLELALRQKLDVKKQEGQLHLTNLMLNRVRFATNARELKSAVLAFVRYAKANHVTGHWQKGDKREVAMIHHAVSKITAHRSVIKLAYLELSNKQYYQIERFEQKMQAQQHAESVTVSSDSKLVQAVYENYLWHCRMFGEEKTRLLDAIKTKKASFPELVASVEFLPSVDFDLPSKDPQMPTSNGSLLLLSCLVLVGCIKVKRGRGNLCDL